MSEKLNRGGYAEDVPDGIHQHKYAGGGYPGCGGFIEALEIECVDPGVIFLIQETITDGDGRRHRWRHFENGGDMLDTFDLIWGSSRRRDGFTAWSDKPFWKTVNYNNWPESDFQHYAQS